MQGLIILWISQIIFVHQSHLQSVCPWFVLHLILLTTACLHLQVHLYFCIIMRCNASTGRYSISAASGVYRGYIIWCEKKLWQSLNFMFLVYIHSKVVIWLSQGDCNQKREKGGIIAGCLPHLPRYAAANTHTANIVNSTSALIMTLPLSCVPSPHLHLTLMVSKVFCIYPTPTGFCLLFLSSTHTLSNTLLTLTHTHAHRTVVWSVKALPNT